MADTFEGGCTCRAVRFRMTSPPLFTHCCHCSWCQRETGSAFVLNAMVESDRVERLAGEPERVVTPSASGKGQVILRCPRCRVAVWSHYAGAGEAVSFVRVGTLDEPARLPPDIHIYTSTKLPWVLLPDGVPAFPEYYRRSELWPAESLARREAMLARQDAIARIDERRSRIGESEPLDIVAEIRAERDRSMPSGPDIPDAQDGSTTAV